MHERIAQLIEQEQARQRDTLSLIPSENLTSRAVREALASGFSHKYAEGYPGARYYAGNEVMDELERFTQEQARVVFHTDYHVNVQPHSGSEANLAVYAAVLSPGDTILAPALDHGGHLSHGHAVTLTGKLYTIVRYGVAEDGRFNLSQVRELALAHKPKLIVAGVSAYPWQLDYAPFREAADSVGAYLMADMSHVAGLVAGGEHPSPFGLADVVTTTTHKTLRGPRGAMIFCKPELASKIDRGVFPGLQGGPHMHTIASIAQALTEAAELSFAVYTQAVVAGMQSMAKALQAGDCELVGGGTNTHLALIDLRPLGLTGTEAQDRLERVGLVANRNSIPDDPAGPRNPSGLRIGTPWGATRGVTSEQWTQLGTLIAGLLTGSVSEETARLAVHTLLTTIPIPHQFS